MVFFRQLSPVTFFSNSLASGRELLPALLVGIAILGFEFGMLSRISPPESSNVTAIGEVVRGEAFKTPPSLHMGPREFCEKWTGKPVDEVDCETGIRLSDLKPARSDTALDVLNLAREQAQEHLKWMKTVRQELDLQRKNRPQQANLVAALSARIDALEGLSEPASAAEDRETQYRALFQWLLLMDGINYDNLRSKFQIKRWDICRILDEPDILARRGLAQQSALANLHWVIILGSAVILTLAFWRAQWLGMICAGVYLCLTNLSILISADAAMHFGENSLKFALNPLGNQLDRQLYIQISGYCIIVALLIARSWVIRFFNVVILNQNIFIWLTALLIVSAYYILKSPALGSESFKVGLAVLAASLMIDQGRTLHLIRKYVPHAFTPRMLWSAVKSVAGKGQLNSNPTARVIAHIAIPLINFTGFGFVMLSLVPLIFHDLGGSLVAALMLITTLFLVFGARPAMLSLGTMVMAGAIVSLTSEKVQGRIALMHDPMTADVSDFARLKAFTEATQPDGFGISHIAWCNERGTCLPKQLLSDYIPTVLNGVNGPWFTTALFVFICLYFSFMAATACWMYLTDRGNTRMASMVAFFLLIATLLQTVITFFGNWRWIPLTGLGVPLIGIGVSTMLAPTLALGLLLMRRRASDAEP
jgi:cell division protein FtsW (lipid II flippase)